MQQAAAVVPQPAPAKHVMPSAAAAAAAMCAAAELLKVQVPLKSFKPKPAAVHRPTVADQVKYIVREGGMWHAGLAAKLKQEQDAMRQQPLLQPQRPPGRPTRTASAPAPVRRAGARLTPVSVQHVEHQRGGASEVRVNGLHVLETDVSVQDALHAAGEAAQRAAAASADDSQRGPSTRSPRGGVLAAGDWIAVPACNPPRKGHAGGERRRRQGQRRRRRRRRRTRVNPLGLALEAAERDATGWDPSAEVDWDGDSPDEDVWTYYSSEEDGDVHARAAPALPAM